MWTDTVLAAVVSGAVGLIVAWMAHRRSTATVRAEAAAGRDAAANEQVRVITAAYEQVLDQLRAEISRLIEARVEERRRLQDRIEELEQRLAAEIAERERLQARVDAIDPTHPNDQEPS